MAACIRMRWSPSATAAPSGSPLDRDENQTTAWLRPGSTRTPVMVTSSRRSSSIRSNSSPSTSCTTWLTRSMRGARLGLTAVLAAVGRAYAANCSQIGRGRSCVDPFGREPAHLDVGLAPDPAFDVVDHLGCVAVGVGDHGHADEGPLPLVLVA